MSDVWKIRLLAAGLIPAGILGLIFVDPTQSNSPLGIFHLKLFGPTGATWIFRIACVGIVLLPIGVMWSRRSEERRFNAYFKRQSMLEPESDHTTRRQQ
ncbi:hypothetical protein [Brucella tritici]|uniref:hypothetical protein n=1 Tax=Brucella tritici TaxID=94626 RepID=UPI003D6D66EC